MSCFKQILEYVGFYGKNFGNINCLALYINMMFMIFPFTKFKVNI